MGGGSLRLLLLACCLPLSGLCLAQNPATKAQLSAIIAAIDEAKTALAANRQAQSALSQAIEQQEREIQQHKQSITGVQQELAANRDRLTQLQRESATLEQQRSSQQTLIAAYLQEAWKQGNQPRLKVLLNHEDPQRASRLLRYHQVFAQARTELVAQYSDTLEQLQALKTETATRLVQLDDQEQTLAQEQESLQRAQNERQRSLAGLDSDANKRRAEIERMEMQRVELEVLLEELRLSISDTEQTGSDEPFRGRRGQMQWPVAGRVTQTFGSRHELGDLTWEGLTIAAPAGTDIHAIHPGRVIFADWFSNSGLLLIIDHGDGYMSLYAHNQELYRAVGDWVGSGEVIAAVGNTGGQLEFGLYFEVRLNGTAENPSSWLKSRN